MQMATVLQIDDVREFLDLGEKVFHEAGFNYIFAENANDGLAKLINNKPDLIILDYDLSDMTGLEFLKKVHSDAAFESIKNTPTIILTGYSNISDQLDDYFALGLRAVLKKPFGYYELVDVVRNIIRLEKATEIYSTLNTKNVSTTRLKEDAVWRDELKMAAETIAGLSREIYYTPNLQLGEKTKMDAYAIYNSSQRLIKLLK
jgi:CheY-like chemotaxis protein